MSIPKQIFQTFKTAELPLLTRFHIWNLKRKNPTYTYFFYDDNAIERFLTEHYDTSVLKTYKKITIGASKADFFRYAVLYKMGGVYVDIDSLIKTRIDDFILPNDEAVIAYETNGMYYCQWALFFSAGHPFLLQTLEDIIHNIESNSYPNDVHKTTGPTAFTNAIKKVLQTNENIPYRQLEFDYSNHAQFSYPLSKFFLYGLSRKGHWKKEQKK